MIKRFKEKINNPYFKELLYSSSSSLIIRIVGMALGYLSMLYITNYHGANIFGTLALLTTIVLIFSIVPRFGMDVALVRIIGELHAHTKNAEIKYVFRKILFFIIFLSVVFALLLFFTSELISKYFFDKTYMVSDIQIMSLTIITSTVMVIIAAIFQGVKKIKTFVFLQLVMQQLFFLLFLLINDQFYLGGEVVTVYVLSSTLSAIVAIIFLFKEFKEFKEFDQNNNNRTPYKYHLKKILIFSYPMLVTGSFAMIMGWTDIIMLGIFLTETDVGVYVVAQKMAGIVSLSLVVVNSVVAPKFAEYYAKKKLLHLESLVHQSTMLIFMASVPLLLLSILAPEFIMSMFGDEFIVGSWALILMAVTQFVNAICGPVGYILQMTDRQKIAQKIVIFAAIINAILNYLLIPVYGINGAALSTMASVFFWNIAMLISIKKELGFWAFYFPKFRV